MKTSDKIRFYSLAFLGRTGIIDIKKMILDGKLKLSPSMAYEFSAGGLGIFIANEVKKIIELMPTKAKDIIYDGSRDAGREATLLLRERLSEGDGAYSLDRALTLVTNCFGMNKMEGGWRKKISKNTTTGNVTECPFSGIIIKEKLPEACMLCEGFCQGVADVVEKGSTVTIPKKLSKGDKYCEFVINKTKPVKEPYLEVKLNLPLDFIHEFTVRELGRILIKMGKKMVKLTTPQTYKIVLFWGGRDAGMEIAEMMKSLGIRNGLNAVEAGTVLFAQCALMERVQIRVSEEENIGRVFRCPWSSTMIRDKSPEVCMICEGFCQGVTDAMTRGCIAEIPKKITKGDEYCEFIYRRTKIMS